MMKKNKRQKESVCVLLLIGGLLVAGCGKAKAGTDGSNVAAEPVTEAVQEVPVTSPDEQQVQTPQPTLQPEENQPEELQPEENQPEENQPEAIQPEEVQPEAVQPENLQPDTTGLFPLAAEEKQVTLGEYDSKDHAVTYAKETCGMPYYVGRDNPESSVDFMKNNKGENDGILYLGLPLYLPDKVLTGTAYVTVDDESVARIEGNELVGVKQGTFTLFSYDGEGNLKEEKKYICTTYNDSKANKESLLSFERDMSRFSNARDPEYWKSAVNTIMDMCYLLEARNFKYDFNGEPEFGVIRNVASNEERWAWTADARTIFEMSRGVCIQVAQLATYMLAGDYEDWGAILSEGNQGHIFNWFYEDGYYYIFDFTQVISDNAANYYSSPLFRDYSKYVKKCKTIEEIRDYCCNEKLSTEHNYAFYMYSCKGHDELPCNLNTGMSDSNAVLTNTWTESEKIIIGFQDVVMEDLVVLFENENSTKIDWKSYTLDEINKNIPHGIYNLPVEYRYRYDY